ncbi:phosphoribosylglycinamide formyltransferase, partial [Bacillus sp. D-CC]
SRIPIRNNYCFLCNNWPCIHPSLLPSFPGKDAVGQALEAGVKVTGVTIHYVDAGMDTGPIIAQEAVVVSDGDTRESLQKKIQQVEQFDSLYLRNESLLQLLSHLLLTLGQQHLF